MKNLLNAFFLLLCLAAGFGLATAWKPLARWWNKPGFEHSEPTLLTGVGDAPAQRGFTLEEPPGDLSKLFEQWHKLWATAVGIRYGPAWTPQQLAAAAKAAHARNFQVILLPPGGFSRINPYPVPLAEVAAEAQAAKVDRLCVAWLDQVPDAGYWQDQTTQVRRVFTGKVILASTDRVAPAITCWDLSDEMGIAGQISLPRRLPHASDVMTFHDLRLAWESQLTSLESLGRTFGKPLALLSTEVPLAVSMKLPLPETMPGTPADNAKLQAIVYEALLAETKGRAMDTQMLLLTWSSTGNRDAANGVAGLLPKIAEAWDPKKPRTPETAPDQFSGEEMLENEADPKDLQLGD